METHDVLMKNMRCLFRIATWWAVFDVTRSLRPLSAKRIDGAVGRKLDPADENRDEKHKEPLSQARIRWGSDEDTYSAHWSGVISHPRLTSGSPYSGASRALSGQHDPWPREGRFRYNDSRAIDLLNVQNQTPQQTEVLTSSFCGAWFGIDQDMCEVRRSRLLVGQLQVASLAEPTQGFV
jgi:hypothetical protein